MKALPTGSGTQISLVAKSEAKCLRLSQPNIYLSFLHFNVGRLENRPNIGCGRTGLWRNDDLSHKSEVCVDVEAEHVACDRKHKWILGELVSGNHEISCVVPSAEYLDAFLRELGPWTIALTDVVIGDIRLPQAGLSETTLTSLQGAFDVIVFISNDDEKCGNNCLNLAAALKIPLYIHSPSERLPVHFVEKLIIRFAEGLAP